MATETETQKLQTITRRTNEPLLVVRSVFPFDFFPTTLIVDIDKVTIRDTIFFSSMQMHSIAVQDLMIATIETNPFFATLRLIDRLFHDQPIAVKFLKLADGRRARRLISGLMVAHREKIDLEKIPMQTLLDQLDSLGAAQA